MASTPSRWEWRTFGPAFGQAESVITPLLTARRTSREVYVVADDSELNVKVRDGQLDVKALQQVSVDGLEQWMPVLKAPLSSAESETFLREFVRQHGQIAIVPMDKVRSGGAFDGCVVEIADVSFDGRPTRTLAVEADDPARVRVALGALGLSPTNNVNYVRALKQFVAARTALAFPGAKEAPSHDEALSA